MGAMVLFGVPPEEFWPYTTADFDEEPPAFCYSFGANYQAVKYYRLDQPEMDPADALADIKTHLASKLPSMFGFTVFDSISQATDDGRIPFPDDRDGVAGGHAVMAVGYDDGMEIAHERGSAATKGAFLIRNSWGTGWGEQGYGWLPYEYLLSRLAEDWWLLLKNEWVATDAFNGTPTSGARRVNGSRGRAKAGKAPVTVGT
jgi:C1A family cysteine protease